jgi:hypothetical protein
MLFGHSNGLHNIRFSVTHAGEHEVVCCPGRSSLLRFMNVRPQMTHTERDGRRVDPIMEEPAGFAAGARGCHRSINRFQSRWLSKLAVNVRQDGRARAGS